jgi:ketopantoate hydroxymethyltransferase
MNDNKQGLGELDKIVQKHDEEANKVKNKTTILTTALGHLAINLESITDKLATAVAAKLKNP